MLDTFGRFHDYLRISLTERCNLRCTYCMPKDGVQLSPPGDLLTSQELMTMVKVFAKLGVRKIRLTGGEPTLRKDLVELCGAISSTPGIEVLALTTNGLLLSRLGRQLKQSGVSRINISLDTLHKERFEAITQRSGLDLVMKGLFGVLDLGFEAVKLNCVVRRNCNEHELVNFVEMTKRHRLQVRFLEYMPFDQNQWTHQSLVSYKEMLETIQQRYPGLAPVDGHPNEVAKMWQVPGHLGQVGFITAMSNQFCGTCNRLRLTNDGKIKSCLFGQEELSIRDAVRQGSEDDIVATIAQAVRNKKHSLGGHASPTAISQSPNRPMILIGG